MAGECKQFLFTSCKGKNKKVNVGNCEFRFFTTVEYNHSSEQWGKLCISIEISQLFSVLNHSQTTKKLHT